MIITRSGRNTLSELAFLGIPAISFVSGCKYRRNEQEQNISSLDSRNIATEALDCTVEVFLSLCKKMLATEKSCNSFCCGNEIAINSIIDLLYE